MQKYTFTRTSATVLDDGKVVLILSTDEEVIEIATDWIHSETASKQNKSYSHTGYIGYGATKHAIYVSNCYFVTYYFY